MCKCDCESILNINHTKLRKQLKSAMCWAKNYKCVLSMTLVNSKIIIPVDIPDFIYALCINLLKKCEVDCASSFYIIEHVNKCCDLVKKRFKKIANYCHCGQMHKLKPTDILPMDICHMNDDNIKNKINKLEGFIRFFDEIITISEAYCGC